MNILKRWLLPGLIAIVAAVMIASAILPWWTSRIFPTFTNETGELAPPPPGPIPTPWEVSHLSLSLRTSGAYPVTWPPSFIVTF